MNHVPNASRDLGTDGWHKPWSGHNGGSCVEIKPLPEGQFALRQSTEPAGPALIFTETELDVFAAGWRPHKAGLQESGPPDPASQQETQRDAGRPGVDDPGT